MTSTYNVEKFERATTIKKDLQKIVKKFRDAQPEGIDADK